MQLVTRLLELQLTLVCYVLPFYSPTRSIRRITRLLENSIATACICAFSHLSFLHAYCCWFRCSMNLLVCICIHTNNIIVCWLCVIHLSHTDVIVGLLIKSSMYICVRVVFGLLLFTISIAYICMYIKNL